jgi:hypothetical protein
MRIKICLICKKEKFITEFHKGNDIDGLRFECKECRKKDTAEYYKKNKEKILKNTKKYYKVHKKEYLEYNKNYYLLNKYKISEKIKDYYLKHKTEIDEYRKKYHQEHRKEILEKTKQKRTQRRIYDIHFKIMCNLRKRIWDALKHNYKSSSTMKLVGCSIEQLKYHLESQFKPGMTWVNYGNWHIDHIRPCASFDLSKPSEQCKCFHYTNLQPLWAEENLRKSDIYE